jgi:cytidylate kinase
MIDAIAIDGPAASGKTAIGSAVARQLGYRFLDTGAMYRAITWAALARGVDVQDEAALALLANSVVVEVDDAVDGSPEATSVTIDRADATPHLRDPDVDANVSFVSRVPEVRKALVRIQREIAREGSIVMVGRDIASVVLPDARVKVYLDASPEVRARRRMDQIRDAGIEPDFDPLVADLKRRDAIDAGREASPLTAAPGAVIINTDDLSREEVVRRVAALAAQA